MPKKERKIIIHLARETVPHKFVLRFFLFARFRFYTHFRSDGHGRISLERWCFFGHSAKMNYREVTERKEIKVTGPAPNKDSSRKRQRRKCAPMKMSSRKNKLKSAETPRSISLAGHLSTGTMPAVPIGCSPVDVL